MDLSKSQVRLHRGTIYLSRVPGDSDTTFARKLTDAVGTCRWHRGHRRWAMSLSRDAVAGLRAAGARLGPEVAGWEREQTQLAAKRRRANSVKAKTRSELDELFEVSGARLKKPLYTHQLVGAAYMIALPACALLMDTGTGKTATVATAMQALFDNVPGFRRVLVVAPKTILNSGWGEDIDDFSWLSWVNISDPPRRPEVKTCPRCQREFKRHVAWRHMATHMKPKLARVAAQVEAETPADVDDRDKVVKDEVKARGQVALYGRHPELRPPAQDDKRTRLLRALGDDDSHQVFLINPEGFKLVIDDLSDQDWDLVVVDESSMLKNPKSAITGKMQLFGGRVKRRVIMTATPRPNSSLDFWGQMAFLDQSLGGNFSAFRSKYFYQGYDGYSWNPKHDDVDRDIWDVVSDRSYRVRLQDCVDLPGETTKRMETTLTPELARHYQDMLTSMSVTIDKGRDGDKVIDTEWRIVQMNKLSQITSGYVFDNDGNAEFLGDSPKVKATLDMARRLIVDEDRHVVIWARYAEEMAMMEESLSKYGVSTCHGRTRNVDASVAAFKNGKNRVMIAHPRSAQFGHTWVKYCNVAIFHSYDYSWEAFYQAKRRIYRIGQKSPVTYLVNVALGTVDEDILTRVFDKESASEAVVDDNVLNDLMRLGESRLNKNA